MILLHNRVGMDCLGKGYTIGPTVLLQVVADQIRLWQAETQRVRHYKAHLYDNFETEQLFRMSAEHARLLGTWLWQDDKNQRLVALSEGHDQMREFIRNNK